MIRRFSLYLLAAFALQLPSKAQAPRVPMSGSGTPEKSAYLAFVDREYIFTIEMVSAGIPLLNFISMSDDENLLAAKEVRLILDNRTAPGKYFIVDTADSKEPVILPSLRMRPRSSFGMRLQGEFGGAKELLGATVRLGAEDFRLVPVTSFAFEDLALKVSRINLASPDFRDDWRILKLETVGTRVRVRRR